LSGGASDEDEEQDLCKREHFEDANNWGSDTCQYGGSESSESRGLNYAASWWRAKEVSWNVGRTNVIIFEFAEFEEEDAEFVVIALFTPNRELLGNFLSFTRNLNRASAQDRIGQHTSSMLPMRLFSILMSWVKRFASSGANVPAVFLRKLRPCWRRIWSPLWRRDDSFK
jgi:hypothetical protein